MTKSGSRKTVGLRIKHEMPSRTSDEKAVRPSVCPSVCQMRVL